LNLFLSPQAWIQYLFLAWYVFLAWFMYGKTPFLTTHKPMQKLFQHPSNVGRQGNPPAYSK